MPVLLLDALVAVANPPRAGEFDVRHTPRNNGVRYPADPSAVEETVTVMRRLAPTLTIGGGVGRLWCCGAPSGHQ